MSETRRPVLCIVAGPNGSGKTSTTQLLLQNEWTADAIYITRYYKSLRNAKQIIPEVDRAYVYDNSIDGETPRLLFRTSDGKVAKQYTEDIPLWAKGLVQK